MKLIEYTTSKNNPCSCDAWTKTRHQYACWMCDKPDGRPIRSEGKKGSHKPIQLTIKFKQTCQDGNN